MSAIKPLIEVRSKTGSEDDFGYLNGKQLETLYDADDIAAINAAHAAVVEPLLAQLAETQRLRDARAEAELAHMRERDALRTDNEKLVSALQQALAHAKPPDTGDDVARMALACPKCDRPHVDRGEWATRRHKTHLCEHCQFEWRPFHFATVGAEVLPPGTVAVPRWLLVSILAYGLSDDDVERLCALLKEERERLGVPR